MPDIIKNIIEYLKLLRPQQWYKNLFIFLPIIFSGLMLTEKKGLLLTIVGFIALCLISSSNYIINDIFDRNRDKAHPEKRSRPLASGKINIISSVAYSIFILLTGGFLSLLLSREFFYLGITLFILTFFYSIALKHEPFIDIILVSGNFVIRSVSGAYIIIESGKPYIEITPWLILCPFFLALFIIIGKRASDSLLLKEEAKLHKKVLISYTPEITRSLSIIGAVLLIVCYIMYIFFSPYDNLILTIPFALYIIFRYYSLIESKSKIPRHPHLLLKDWRIMIAFILFCIITSQIIYPLT